MKDLIICKPQQIADNIISPQLLQDFYNGIDVMDETIRTYKDGIKNFLKWIKNNNIQKLEKQEIKDYKYYLIETYKNTTAATYFSGVKNLFRFLEDYGIPNITRNIKGIKVSKAFRKMPLTKEQVKKIKENKEQNLNSLKDLRDMAIYCLMLYNGLREVELMRINLDDLLCVNGKYIIKIQGKGKLDKTQEIVLTNSALIPLLNYLEKRGKDEFEPLFIGLANNMYGTRLTTRSIRRIISQMFKDNGCISKYITPHSLRHTSVTAALEGGASLQEAQILARHSNCNTTLIYSHNIERFNNAPEYYVEKYLNS